MKARIAQALGWPIADVRGFSLLTLRELVRESHPGLASQITQAIRSGAVLTNENGIPFEPPTTPESDADIEAKIAYIRARHAYNDAIADCANKAFVERFRP